MKYFLISLTIVLSASITKASDDNNCLKRWESMFNSSKTDSLSYELVGQCDQDLKSSLQANAATGHVALEYYDAKMAMYRNIDVHDNLLCSVYSPHECNARRPFKHNINCEHTWPKSKGAKNYPMLSDLHHLFPAEKGLNEMRGNYPFCEVAHVTYERDGSRFGRDENNDVCFEPPHSHKGNVARAMFYFAMRYSYHIAKDKEDLFREWNQLDPVSDEESTRNSEIEILQGNRNPFVDNNFLIDLISDF